MIKVLIADDEPIICKLIQNLIDWESLGFSIIGTCYTGIDTDHMIDECHPDVVITDIRMPGYDGLEVIRRSKEKGQNITFIMISGFKQFEYAQTAMKYGVRYYLLKPIEEEKLQEIILEIKAELTASKQELRYIEKLEKETKENKNKLKRRFLASMIQERFDAVNPEGKNREEINKEYDTSFSDGSYQAFYVKIDRDYPEDTDLDMLISMMKNKCTEVLEEFCEEFILTEMHSGVIALVNYSAAKKQQYSKAIEEIYFYFKQYLEQFHGFSIKIGVGSTCNHFYDSQYCLKTAMDAIKYRIRIKEPILYYDSYAFEIYRIEEIEEAEAKRYLSFVAVQDKEALRFHLNEKLFQMHHQPEIFSPACEFDLLKNYIKLLSDYCEENQYTDAGIKKAFQNWEYILENIQSEKELLEETLDTIDTICSQIAVIRKERGVQPIRKIKTYVDNNLMNEITMEQLAELVNMNASYLSTYFKKEMNMNFSEYLTGRRMEKARQLLVETQLSIYEVACQCGYQEARYFSRQFTKNVGLKPSEYRKLYS